MKLVSFTYLRQSSFGIVDGDLVYDLAPLKEALGGSLRAALGSGGVDRLRDVDRRTLPARSLDAIEFLPVIPDPDKILCIGINYATHVRETGREMPAYPMIFTRYPDSQTGHKQAIVRPRNSHKLDFEGELAVVIGHAGRHIKADDALDFVAGYSCYNDGSVRDWQRHTVQFTPGKNFPKTGAFGPWLVTADEIPDPQQLRLTTRLNGDVMQDTDTGDMIFGVAKLIEYCSAFTSLAPGDVLITGTTGGVGAFREPPVWMKPGDQVEVEISSIGTLKNPIVDEVP